MNPLSTCFKLLRLARFSIDDIKPTSVRALVFVTLGVRARVAKSACFMIASAIVFSVHHEWKIEHVLGWYNF